MKRKYQISSKTEALLLNFTIRRKVLNTKYYGKQLHASINMLTLHPDILKIFGSFDSFCQFVSLNPQNLHYDQNEFSLVIQFEAINKKYIYIPIFEIQEQKTRKNLQYLIILQQAVMNFKRQFLAKSISQSFELLLKQVQWYSQNMKIAKSQCEKVKLQIKKIDLQLKKLYKKTEGSELKIKKQSLSLQVKQDSDLEQNIQKNYNKAQLFMREEIDQNDLRLKKLKEMSPKSVIVMDLVNLSLKSMLIINPYKNLKVIRLSNNFIKIIEGLQKLSDLTTLDLNTNKIQDIKGLQNNLVLKQLILHSNSISKIKNIFHLKKLQILSLSFNKLIEVTAKIAELESLVELRLQNNQIHILPEKFLNMKELKVVTLVGNPCFTSNHRMQYLIDSLVDKKNITTISRDY